MAQCPQQHEPPAGSAQQAYLGAVFRINSIGPGFITTPLLEALAVGRQTITGRIQAD